MTLLHRIETAEAGSRELDAEIEDAIGPESEHPGSHLLGGFSKGRNDYLMHVAPHYTTNLQDAVDLVEAEKGVAIMRVPAGWAAHVGEVGDYQHGDYCRAATPALALCAAILRAKEVT